MDARVKAVVVDCHEQMSWICFLLTKVKLFFEWKTKDEILEHFQLLLMAKWWRVLQFSPSSANVVVDRRLTKNMLGKVRMSGRTGNRFGKIKKDYLNTKYCQSTNCISHHIQLWGQICSPGSCRVWLLSRGTWSWWTWNSNKRFSAKISFVKNKNQQRRRWTSRWRERE